MQQLLKRLQRVLYEDGYGGIAAIKRGEQHCLMEREIPAHIVSPSHLEFFYSVSLV